MGWGTHIGGGGGGGGGVVWWCPPGGWYVTHVFKFKLFFTISQSFINLKLR